MSNIGNKIKAGFFALPPRQGSFLREILTFEGDCSVFDPTCGEGAILAQLTANHGDESIIKTYGVELDKGRAQLAAEALDKLVQAPIESMVISHDIFSMVLLNPPYDHTIKGYGDSKTERKEFIELKRNTNYLKPGGVLIYTIPSYRFSDEKIARFLSTQFEDIGMMKFSEEDYPEFRQCIFIGKKKKSVRKEFNEPLYNFLRNMVQESFVEEKVTCIKKYIGHKNWSVPVGSTDIPTFYSRIENKLDFIKLIKENKGFEAFKNRTKPKQLDLVGNPPINIAQGQMALLLASGAVNGLIGSGDTLHVLQGTENKEMIPTTTETEHSTVIKTRTKRSVIIKAILPTGKVVKFMG